MNRKSRGQEGERIAERFLAKQGYKILDRNFHTRWGELDIVARDKDVVVFVEVKARRDADFAQPEESVTPTKQEHLKKAAELWLLENYKGELPACRFDVVSVVFDENETRITEHFVDAFA
jgi:putative endonuclease